MTKGAKVGNVILGVIIVGSGALLFLYPEQGIVVAAVIISISFSVRGLGAMLYYFTMARNMVGGRRSLYRGMLFIDLGILTSAMVMGAGAYIAMYLAGIHAFTGVVDILRSREAKNAGARDWYWTLINGIVNLFISVCVIVGGVVLDSTQLVVYIYAIGVISYGIQRITNALRTTAIVYIQ